MDGATWSHPQVPDHCRSCPESEEGIRNLANHFALPRVFALHQQRVFSKKRSFRLFCLLARALQEAFPKGYINVMSLTPHTPPDPATTPASITLDGSQGEGGGQILRSALALSLITGRPFRIHRIRARRPKPGLMRQHLACVEAAVRIGSATVEDATLGSQELTFTPGPIATGTHAFRIASSGSTMLLLQSILPPLLLARQPSDLVLEGGTHNPFAPPFPFIEQAFLPLLRRIGFDVTATLERPGFHPNGGGRCRVSIRPASELHRLRLEPTPAPGIPTAAWARVCLAGLPRQIAQWEAETLRRRLALGTDSCVINEHTEALGPGNTVHVGTAGDGFANVFTSFGAPRVRAERVAADAIASAEAFIASGASVDEHLADQLLLPLAIARGGDFTTTALSEHTRTQSMILREFLPVTVTTEPISPAVWRVRVEP
jgi:RNA 3'-terminal phosphate cyclase (ATP)